MATCHKCGKAMSEVEYDEHNCFCEHYYNCEIRGACQGYDFNCSDYEPEVD